MQNTVVKNVSASEIYQDIIESKKEDFMTPRNKIRVIADNGKAFINLNDEYKFDMTSHAIEQLDSSIAPGFMTYGRWLRANNRLDMYVSNVNDFLSKEKQTEKVQIRTIQKQASEIATARALVSPSFKPIDDDIIYSTALPILESYKNTFNILGGHRTETHSFLKVVSAKPMFSMNVAGKERNFSVGFIMKNSEVGCGFCEFTLFITDHFCTNGTIFSKTIVADVKHMHRGTKLPIEFGNITQENIDRLDSKTTYAQIAEAVTNACNYENYQEISKILTAAAERRYTGSNVDALARGIAKEYNITRNERELFMRHYDTSDNSLFGIQAAVTRLAQDTNSYNRRIELEAIGGRILTASPREWSNINSMSLEQID